MGKPWAYVPLHQFIWLLIILIYLFIYFQISGNFPVLHVVTRYFCATGVERRQEQLPPAEAQLQCNLVIVKGLEGKMCEERLRSVGLIRPEQRRLRGETSWQLQLLTGSRGNSMELHPRRVHLGKEQTPQGSGHSTELLES